MMDTDLSITIVHKDGTSDRWGPDEPDGHDVPNDLQFTTSIPGGDKDLSCSLQRGLKSYDDQVLFDDLFVYGPGNDTVWNGYMGNFPYDDTSVKPTAIGWINSLRFDTTAREVYCERDQSIWRSASVQRKETYPGYIFEDPTGVVTDSTSPALQTQVTGAWSKAVISEAWLDTKGIPLQSLYYAWKLGNGLVNGPPAYTDSNWSWGAFFSSDDIGTTSDNSGTLRGAGPGTGHLDATTSTRTLALVQVMYNGASGNDSLVYAIYWTALAAIGRHGLTLRGSWTSSGGIGFYPSDIIADIIKRWGTNLNYTYPGSIEQDTSFIVESFAQYDPSTGNDMMMLVNAYQQKDWGVYSGGEDNYPDRTFFLREPDPFRLTWHARRSDGATLTNEGVQAEDVVNGVTVNFTGYDGQTYSVGPPGSGCIFTDAALQDTDPDNPVNAHNIGPKYGRMDLSKKTNLAGAVTIGSVWLYRRLGIQRRGTLTATGWIRHPSGILMPTSKMRSGDYVIVEDDLRDQVPRKIVNTTYTHRSRSNMCDLEHDAFRIDAMMEQLGAQLVSLGG